MNYVVLALYLSIALLHCTDGADNTSCSSCQVCHEYVASVKDEYCSKEKKFVIGLNKVNWFQALENCELSGYRLASILSQEETDSLLAYIQEQGEEDNLFWLSGTDLQLEGDFVWATSPSTAFSGYTNWYPQGEPSNGGGSGEENCVQLEPEGTWNDRSCYDNLRYACHYFSAR